LAVCPDWVQAQEEMSPEYRAVAPDPEVVAAMLTSTELNGLKGYLKEPE